MLDDENERSDYAKRRCPNCPHPMIIHARHGGCYGQVCLCGWSHEAGTGALIVASTGKQAVETKTGQKKYRGARIGNGRREHLMKIPCYFCGGRSETIDHLIARAKGGTNDASNLVSACVTCNSMKGDKSYDELIAFCMELRVSTCRKTAMRHVLRFQKYKVQVEKILAWHDSRMKSKQLVPVV